MSTYIIALCGKKRSGKDTIAKYLCETRGCVHAKFAAPLKGALKELFGFTEDQLEATKDVVDDFWGICPRTAMQFIGSEVAQMEFQKLLPGIGRSFFVKSLLARHAHDERVVISDMRFLHEFEAVRKHTRNLIIKVVRPGVDDGCEHMSETELENITDVVVVVNDGSVENLCLAVETIVDNFENEKK